MSENELGLFADRACEPPTGRRLRPPHAKRRLREFKSRSHTKLCQTLAIHQLMVLEIRRAS